MKKLLAVLIVLVLLVPVIGLAAAKDEVFTYGDGIKFGMSKKEVQKIAGEPSDESDTVLAYAGAKVAGKDATLGYIFDSDKLVQIFVHFTEEHTYEGDFIDDFEKIDKALSTIYPAGDYTDFYYWKNDLYKDDEENYGFAISAGQLSIGSNYKNSSVVIYHLLSGDNFTISHTITYESPDYVETTDTSGL